MFIATNIQASFEEMKTGGRNIYLSFSGQVENSNNNCFYLFGTLNDAPPTGTNDDLDLQNETNTVINIGKCIRISHNNNNHVYNAKTLGNFGEFININFSRIY